jgi:hypothetical protein
VNYRDKVKRYGKTWLRVEIIKTLFLAAAAVIAAANYGLICLSSFSGKRSFE